MDATSQQKLNRFLLKTWLGCFAACVFVSYAVFFWTSFGSLQRFQGATLRRMDSVAKYQIRPYHEKNGEFPDSLDKCESHGYRRSDLWDNPFVYTSDGETWRLVSYGADGKPGGIGLDTDIIIDDKTFQIYEVRRELWKTASPTYWQVFSRSWKFFKLACFFGLFFSIMGIGFLPNGNRDLLTGKKIYTEPSNDLAALCIGGSALASAFFSLLLMGIASLGDVF